MNAVGIDVSKNKSMVAIVRPFGEVISKPFEVNHTSTEILGLIKHIQGIGGDTKIVMEHTGRYFEPMAQSLSAAGLFVCAVNPKLIKDFNNNSLRKVKTDKADAMKIARYTLNNWTELKRYSLVDEKRSQLKTMNRQYGFYTKQKTACKNNLIGILDSTYPKVNTLFNSPVREDGSQKWIDFATTYWHVECVRTMSLPAFTEHYRKWCKRKGYNFQPSKPITIYDASRELISTFPKDNVTKMLIMQAIEQLNATSKIVAELRSQMNQLASELPEYPVVMAMTGVGSSLGPQLIAEIGDVERFSHRGALTAFAGVDPGANQSGTYDQKSVRSSKRGSYAKGGA